MIKMLSFLAPFGMPIINPKVAHALVDACEALTIVRRDATASDRYWPQNVFSKPRIVTLDALPNIDQTWLSERARSVLTTPPQQINIHDIALYYGSYVYDASDGPELSLDMMEFRNYLIAMFDLTPLVTDEVRDVRWERPEPNGWLATITYLPQLTALAAAEAAEIVYVSREYFVALSRIALTDQRESRFTWDGVTHRLVSPAAGRSVPWEDCG
jgi:hypothetical protein